MNREDPAGIGPVNDSLEEVAAVEVSVGSSHGGGLSVGEERHALLGVEVIFYPEFLASGVHPHIRMRTVAVHVAPGTRPAALAHHVGYLMRAFGIVGPVVPLHVVVAKPCVRQPLLATDEVRKLHRVEYEEERRFVAN